MGAAILRGNGVSTYFSLHQSRPAPAAGPLCHVVGVLNCESGYGVHAVNFIRALSRRCECLATDPLASDPRHRRTVFERLNAESARGRPVINIAIFDPVAANHLLQGLPGVRIGFSVSETTLIAPEWVEAARQLDRLWTASEWNRTVYLSAGMAPDRVEVVPEGVDVSLFNPYGPRHRGLTVLDKVRFLAVGKFEPRKASAELIRAFDDEFCDRTDVALVLVCTNRFVAGFDLTAELNRLHLKAPANILSLDWLPNAEDIASVYRACDAFVAPTRGEGWAYPLPKRWPAAFQPS